MVTAPECTDAITRARSLPTLNIGLHLVLTDGYACLPPAQIPDLVDRNGAFHKQQISSGIRFYFLPQVRKQLEAEIRAQFESFRQSGLRLDHVNGHQHMHIHPTIVEMIVRIGKDYGLKAVRVPHEPPLASLIFNQRQKLQRYAHWLFFKPLVAHMKKTLDANHITYNDYVFGLHDSGHLNIETLVHMLPHLPDGLSELYLHPATHLWEHPSAPPAVGYEYVAEYEALIHPRIKRLIEKFSIELCSYGNPG